MSDLPSTLASALSTRYTTNATRVRELAAPLTNSQFWQKPFPFGNSFGHLVLHLTGNLNYYIGAQIAQTGYIRDRPREFNDPNPPQKNEALQLFDSAVAMVVKTIGAQSVDDWSSHYSAVGSDAPTRLEIMLVCAAHMQHHIGQMIYLKHQWERYSAMFQKWNSKSPNALFLARFLREKACPEFAEGWGIFYRADWKGRQASSAVEIRTLPEFHRPARE